MTSSNNWPSIQYTPANSGYLSSQSTPKLYYSETWEYSTSARIAGGPIVGDGQVIFRVQSGDRRSIISVDAQSGDFQWKTDLANIASYKTAGGAPAYDQGRVFAGARDQRMYALSSSDGSVEWKYTTSAEITNSPIVSNSVVYFGNRNNNAFALNAENGDLVWKESVGSSSYSIDGTQAVQNGLVYIGSGDGVYALDTETGNVQWNYTGLVSQIANTTVKDNYLYFGTGSGGSDPGDKTLYALDASNGQFQWKQQFNTGFQNGVAVAYGSVFAAGNKDDDTGVYAFDKETGNKKWYFPAGPTLPIVVSNETVYACTSDGIVYALNPDTGTERWKFSMGNSGGRAPAIADGTIYIGGGGGSIFALESYTNSTSPSASFSISNTTPKPDQSITFDAGESAGDIDQYSWDFGDGNSETGQSVAHSYTSSGDYTVELTVDGPAGSDTATGTISVTSDTSIGISVQPSNPVVGEAAVFSGSGGKNYQWNFDDGNSASGQEVTHEFTSSGTYTVELTTDNGSKTLDVPVDSANFQISEISRSVGGTPLESISYEETFSVSISTNDTIDYVVFELGDNSKSDSIQSDGWDATFDLGNLTETVVLAVKAVSSNGAQTANQIGVPIQPLPVWMEWIIDNGGVTVDTNNAQIDLQYAPFDLSSYSFGLGTIPIDVSPPVFNGSPKAKVQYDAVSQTALVDGEGAINPELFGYSLSLALEVNGTVDEDLQLLSASGTGSLSIGIQVGPPLYVDPPDIVPCLDDKIGIETTVTPGVTLSGSFDGDFQFQSGTVSPSVNITVGAQLDFCGIGAGAEVTGGLSGSFDIGTSDRNLSGTISGTGTVWFDFSIKTVEVSVGFDEQLGSGSTTVTAVSSPQESDWQTVPMSGSRPVPTISSVDDTSTVSAASALHPTGSSTGTYDRITDRTIEDTQPTLATTSSETIVAWSRQLDSKTANDGRDIAVRRNDGSGWSSITLVTDDTRSDESPAMAATANGNLLLAWERVDTNITDSTTPSDLHPHYEIMYAVYDGSSWSTPQTLTDSSAREFNPTVAADGDGWLLAWQTEATVNASSQDVRHVDISPSGSAGTLQRVTDAVFPAVGEHTDTGAALGYTTLASGATDQVVWKRIAGGSVAESASFSAGTVTAVAAGQDRVVWSEGTVDAATLIEGDSQAGSTTSLALRDGVSAVAEPRLTTNGQDAVLSYRSYVQSADSRKLVYRLDRGNGWIYDREYVQPPETDHSVWQLSPVFDPAGNKFKTAFAVTEQIQTGKNDIFVAEHQFAIEYGISASGPTGASAGDTVTLSYSVVNRGDIDATDQIKIVFKNSTGTLTSETVGPLAANETASGSADVTVDETGEFTVAVEQITSQTLPQLSSDSTNYDAYQTSATVATPDLAIDDVVTTGADTAELTIRNTGGATATNVPLEIRDSGSQIYSTTVSSIPYQGTTTVSVTVSPSSLDRTVPERVLIDPDETLPDAVADNNRETQWWLLQPDLVVTDEITYRRRFSQGLVAEVVVGNRNPVAGDATLRAIATGEGAIAGETTETIPAATNGTAYTTVTIPLDDTVVTAGDGLKVDADTSVPDADASTTVTKDDLETIFDFSSSVAWSMPSGGRAQYTKVVADGDYLYAGGLDARLSVLSQSTGQEVWGLDRDGALSDSSPLLHNGVVFIGSGGGTFYAITFDQAQEQGSVKWEVTVDSAITSTPVVANSTVYFGTNDGMIHARNLSDGSAKWSKSVSGPVFSDLAATSNSVVATTKDGTVVALDQSTGGVTWQYDTGTELGASGPTVANGTVYVAADSVYAFDAGTGNQVWSSPFSYGGTAGSSPAVYGSTVVAGSADGLVYAINVSDGSEAWRYDTGSAVASDITVTSEQVIAASLDGALAVLDGDDGHPELTRSLSGQVRGTPEVSGSQVYIGTENAEIINVSFE